MTKQTDKPFCCVIGCDADAEWEIVTVRDVARQIQQIDVVFDGPPGPVSGRFVETEDMAGSSIRAGMWLNRGDGFWALRIPFAQDGIAGPDPYSDFTHACTDHVGELLGYQPDANAPQYIYWHVRPLDKAA